MIKISVIVPVYNVEKYLTECIESIINQTFKDIEIICVNDGSTDNSLKILEEFAAKDSRIKIISETNGGLTVARHNGMDIASGEYILFLDSDDWIDKTLLEKTYAKITETNTDMIFFGSNTVKNNKVSQGMYSTRKFPNKFKNKVLTLNDYSNNLFSFPPTAWSKLYRKNFIIENNIKFQEIRYGEDQLFYLHAMLTAKSIYVLNENLLYYVKNRTGSITCNPLKKTISPMEHFYASEKLLRDLNLVDEYINQVINKHYAKSLSWYGKCSEDFKQEYFKHLLLLEEHINTNYPKSWCRHLKVKTDDTYLTIKLKIFIAKLKYKLKKGNQ